MKTFLSFENQEFENREVEEKIYAKVRDFLKDNPPIDPDGFADLYAREIIDRDKRYVAGLEKKFFKQAEKNLEREHRQQLALIFEALVLDQTERSDWLGENAMTVRSSKFDDYVNGVDMIVEFPEEVSRHLALAMDVTTSNILAKKFSRIREEINDSRLPRVKYYDSKDFHGGLPKVPRVIIGADRQSVWQAGELWLENKNKELAVCPMQKIILDEIIIQLKTFSEYAAGRGKKEIADSYGASLKIMERIINEKKERNLPLPLINDKVFSAIIECCENFNKEVDF
ncbi:MAG: hypothetical protein AAB564_01420 [Patescibacteria group bacterium]